MDKEKQIEEMARIFGSCKIFPNCITCDRHTGIRGCYNRDRAKVLYEHGYRKINENEVVISKEEYETKKEIVANWGFLQQEIMQGRFVALADLEKDGKVVISKEEYEKITKELVTEQRAKEIAQEFFGIVRKETAREILEIGKYCMPSGLREWIIKQYGVDLGEEK